MIVQLRGESGSGKSTVVRKLLEEHNGQEVEGHARPWGITGTLWRCDGDLYVFGSYNLHSESSSGVGGDRISGPTGAALVLHYARQVPHLLWESKRGSVEISWEGTWKSTGVPRRPWYDEMRTLGYVWAMLNTSADECIRRIRQRQVERQRGGSLNEERLRQQHEYSRRLAARAAAAGLPVVTINHEHAYAQLHDLFVSGGWECPRHALQWQWSTTAIAS